MSSTVDRVRIILKTGVILSAAMDRLDFYLENFPVESVDPMPVRM